MHGDFQYVALGFVFRRRAWVTGLSLTFSQLPIIILPALAKPRGAESGDRDPSSLDELPAEKTPGPFFRNVERWIEPLREFPIRGEFFAEDRLAL